MNNGRSVDYCRIENVAARFAESFTSYDESAALRAAENVLFAKGRRGDC